MMTMLLAVSLLSNSESLALVSLSLLVWVLFEWMIFKSVALASRNRWNQCVRRVNGDKGDRITMVTDRNFEVVLSGKIPQGTGGYRFLIQDTVPDTFIVDSGRSYFVIDSKGSDRFECRYSVQTSICGRVDLPGIRVEMSDPWGLFRVEHFVPIEQQATVLPFLIRPKTTVSVLKHNNLQQHIGHHRHRTSGISSELLGIRDYRVGDPPRTIAWKPTARLGKVMTCEFENEVPIRATIILDLAAYQFQGRPGPSAADRAILIAASMAKLLLADRDPVAAILLNTSHSHRIKHGGGERQLAKIMQYLMLSSDPNPPLHKFSIDNLVEVVFDNSVRRFPHLYDELFNTGPTRKAFFQPKAGRRRKIRAATALVLEHLLDLNPAMATRLQFDDQEMGNACLGYVNRFGVVASSTTTSLDTPGYNPAQWRYERQRMTQSVCEALIESRSRAKDNELFIVVSPEPIDRVGYDILENAIRATVATRHRLIYVAPEPPRLSEKVGDPVAARILDRTDLSEQRNAESDFKTMVNSLGASFSRLDAPELMQIVAMEVGLLQSGKSRGKTMRSR